MTGVAGDRASVALQRTGGELDRTGVALQRTGVALQRTGGALDRTCVALQDWWCTRKERRCIIQDWRCMAEDWCCNAEDWRSTRQDWRCDIKVHICSPFGARRRTYCGATNIFQRDIHTHARTCVRTSSQLGVSALLERLFTPYLVVELSTNAEIWRVYATSMYDGTQILTFPGINNNRGFRNSRFFYGI